MERSFMYDEPERTRKEKVVAEWGYSPVTKLHQKLYYFFTAFIYLFYLYIININFTYY